MSFLPGVNFFGFEEAALFRMGVDNFLPFPDDAGLFEFFFLVLPPPDDNKR